MLTALLAGLLAVSVRLPLRAGAGASARAPGRPGLPARFWLYAAFAVCYGICETMNGNWSQLDMITRLGASATQASLALAVFWAMVTVGRVLFAATGRWLPERAAYRILPSARPDHRPHLRDHLPRSRRSGLRVHLRLDSVSQLAPARNASTSAANSA